LNVWKKELKVVTLIQSVFLSQQFDTFIGKFGALKLRL
jgi:hypothetical protein